MSKSPMSITQLCNNNDQLEDSIDTQDSDVPLAAEVLDNLSKSKNIISSNQPITLPPISTISTPSTTPSTPLLATPSGSIKSARQSFSSDSTYDEDLLATQPQPQQQQHFIRRVSNHPLVHSALRVYESSKASSPVVKYGAEMVESFASPIYDKFGPQHPSSSSSSNTTNHHQMDTAYPNEEDPTVAATTALANASLNDNYETHRRRHSREESLHIKKSTSRSGSRSTSPHRPYTLSAKSPTAIHHHRPLPATSKSRWKQLVVHAGSAAGTTAAVISEESMKCLKYCLSWLQYASQHIDQQMKLLRDVLVSLAVKSSSSSSSSAPSNSRTVVTTDESNAAGTLTAIKKEVIETLRKVVEIITKYAGVGLPEQAKASVRSFILALPSRWALLNSSTTQSPMTSPALGPHQQQPEVQDSSIKLLNFGSESVEMLQSVSNVFSDTIDRAELWLDRLHSVGMTRRSTPNSNTTRKNNPNDPPMETIQEQQASTSSSASTSVNTSTVEPMETN
ncbi:unnamed protein product [Cunninghamella echinulata]